MLLVLLLPPALKRGGEDGVEEEEERDGQARLHEAQDFYGAEGADAVAGIFLQKRMVWAMACSMT